jgi:hypothetical protein
MALPNDKFLLVLAITVLALFVLKSLLPGESTLPGTGPNADGVPAPAA